MLFALVRSQRGGTTPNTGTGGQSRPRAPLPADDLSFPQRMHGATRAREIDSGRPGVVATTEILGGDVVLRISPDMDGYLLLTGSDGENILAGRHRITGSADW